MLRLLTFNIWLGGEKCGPLDKAAEIIRQANPDVAAIQEADGNLDRLAEMTGLKADHAASLLTRLDVQDSGGFDEASIGWARLSHEGRPLWVANLHLASKGYTPYEVRRGEPASRIAEFEELSGRPEEVRQILNAMHSLGWEQDSAVVMGSLNCPSHLDWTERAKSLHLNTVGEWPVTLLLEAEGFADAYRTVHPDETTHLGYTWSPGYPPGRVSKTEVHDRIDMIYTRPLSAHTAQVIGEPGEYSDTQHEAWPSDRRAVLVEVAR